mmetsp:Transcript_10894/g.24969  ORF Transcript_10894/g.24969 Transcript_10894/m.24969 type:complete len:99 (+) Transcript_10894:78-374(+)
MGDELVQLAWSGELERKQAAGERLSGSEVKALRLKNYQMESNSWPLIKSHAETAAEARHDAHMSFAISFSSEFKNYRPDLPGGPLAEGGPAGGGRRSM